MHADERRYTFDMMIAAKIWSVRSVVCAFIGGETNFGSSTVPEGVSEMAGNLDDITRAVIGCAMAVSNKLGGGFLEKVYENAMLIELRKAGLQAVAQAPVAVYYDDEPVGEYFADILVEGAVVIEVKAVKALVDAHAAQCLNYLKATGLTVCILVNFAKARLEWKRVVLNYQEDSSAAKLAGD